MKRSKIDRALSPLAQLGRHLWRQLRRLVDGQSDAGGKTRPGRTLAVETLEERVLLTGAVVSDSAFDPDAFESNGDQGSFWVTRQEGNINQPLEVSFTVGGSATFGNDYGLSDNPLALANNHITLAAGEIGKYVTVSPMADPNDDGEEMVIFTLVATADYSPKRCPGEHPAGSSQHQRGRGFGHPGRQRQRQRCRLRLDAGDIERGPRHADGGGHERGHGHGRRHGQRDYQRIPWRPWPGCITRPRPTTTAATP